MVLADIGKLHESLEETERAYRPDVLNRCRRICSDWRAWPPAALRPCPIKIWWRECPNELPGCEPAAGQGFLGDWAAVDPLLDPAAKFPWREFQDDGVHPGQAHPTPENIRGIQSRSAASRADRLGRRSRLVYAAHLGLVDEAYRTPRSSSRPTPTIDDIMGSDATARRCCSMPGCQSCATFFVRPLCARGAGRDLVVQGQVADGFDEVPTTQGRVLHGTSHPIEEFGF